MDTALFEAERGRLTAIAARILGASAEADDVVQEAWLRFSRADGVDEPSAWLTTVAFLAAARGGELESLVGLLSPDAVMRADAVGQRMGAEALYEGAGAVAVRFRGGARGARAILIDDEPGLAWVVGGVVNVAFAFHLEGGLVREIELIADPEVLGAMSIVPTGVPENGSDQWGSQA